ncbi:MAG: carboxypeptidase [Actinomycetota bacterium]|nr:carboxypeptidase [Actinomycetota bacterium]
MAALRSELRGGGLLRPHDVEGATMRPSSRASAPSPHPTPPPRSRRRLVVGAVGGLLTAGLAASAVPASGDSGEDLRSTLVSAPATLQTPFERSNGAQWTTVEESHRFWRRLDESSDRVEVDRIGSSVQDRPLQLVQVGAPAPSDVDEAAQGSVLMYVCSVHGDEPSGREACMQLARDMATSEDPEVTRMLRETTVLFLNPNPDGWVANTRGNADGVDVNRDFMEVATPEGAAVVQTIRDWRPDVLNDLHEYGPREFYDRDLLHLWPRNREVDDALYRLSVQMNNEYSAPLVESRGHTSGIYGVLVKDGEPFQQVAGDGQARILRNYSGLQHSVGMLSETADAPLTPEEEADPALMNRRRVDVNYTSAVGSANMIAENRTTIARQTALAAQRATEAGAAQDGVVYFAGQDNMLPTSTSGADPTPMCGYRLSAAQLQAWQPTMRNHGITWTDDGGGAFVSMAQPDAPLIPLLFDERSEYRLTEATPVDDC